MTPEELATIRERHQEAVFEAYVDGRREPLRHKTGECTDDDQPWPCDTAQLLAHIDAITEAVEGLPHGQVWEYRKAPRDVVDRAAVLALLRGTPQ